MTSQTAYTFSKDIMNQNQIIVFTGGESTQTNEGSWETLNDRIFKVASYYTGKYSEIIRFENDLPVYIEIDEKGDEHIVYNSNLLKEGKFYQIELSDDSNWAIQKIKDKIKIMKLKKVSSDKENQSRG